MTTKRTNNGPKRSCGRPRKTPRVPTPTPPPPQAAAPEDVEDLQDDDVADVLDARQGAESSDDDGAVVLDSGAEERDSEEEMEEPQPSTSGVGVDEVSESVQLSEEMRYLSGECRILSDRIRRQFENIISCAPLKNEEERRHFVNSVWSNSEGLEQFMDYQRKLIKCGGAARLTRAEEAVMEYGISLTETACVPKKFETWSETLSKKEKKKIEIFMENTKNISRFIILTHSRNRIEAYERACHAETTSAFRRPASGRIRRPVKVVPKRSEDLEDVEEEEDEEEDQPDQRNGSASSSGIKLDNPLYASVFPEGSSSQSGTSSSSYGETDWLGKSPSPTPYGGNGATGQSSRSQTPPARSAPPTRQPPAKKQKVNGASTSSTTSQDVVSPGEGPASTAEPPKVRRHTSSATQGLPSVARSNGSSANGSNGQREHVRRQSGVIKKSSKTSKTVKPAVPLQNGLIVVNRVLDSARRPAKPSLNGSAEPSRPSPAPQATAKSPRQSPAPQDTATTAKAAKNNGAHAAAGLNGHVVNGTTGYSSSPDAHAAAGSNGHMDPAPRSSSSRSRSPAANGFQGFSRGSNERFSQEGSRSGTQTRLPNGTFGRKVASKSPASRGGSADSGSSPIEPPSPSADGFAVPQFPAVRRRSEQSRSSSRQPDTSSSSSQPPPDYDLEDEKPSDEYLLALLENVAAQQNRIAHKLNNPDKNQRYFDVETGSDLNFDKRMERVREASVIDAIVSRAQGDMAGSPDIPYMSQRPLTYGEILDQREAQAKSGVSHRDVMPGFDDEIQDTTPPACQVEDVEAPPSPRPCLQEDPEPSPARDRAPKTRDPKRSRTAATDSRTPNGQKRLGAGPSTSSKKAKTSERSHSSRQNDPPAVKPGNYFPTAPPEGSLEATAITLPDAAKDTIKRVNEYGISLPTPTTSSQAFVEQVRRTPIQTPPKDSRIQLDHTGRLTKLGSSESSPVQSRVDLLKLLKQQMTPCEFPDTSNKPSISRTLSRDHTPASWSGAAAPGTSSRGMERRPGSATVESRSISTRQAFQQPQMSRSAIRDGSAERKRALEDAVQARGRHKLNSGDSGASESRVIRNLSPEAPRDTRRQVPKTEEDSSRRRDPSADNALSTLESRRRGRVPEGSRGSESSAASSKVDSTPRRRPDQQSPAVPPATRTAQDPEDPSDNGRDQGPRTERMDASGSSANALADPSAQDPNESRDNRRDQGPRTGTTDVSGSSATPSTVPPANPSAQDPHASRETRKRPAPQTSRADGESSRTRPQRRQSPAAPNDTSTAGPAPPPADDTTDDSAPGPSVPVRRGPGRPRKNPQPNNGTAQPNPPPRRAPRPNRRAWAAAAVAARRLRRLANVPHLRVNAENKPEREEGG